MIQKKVLKKKNYLFSYKSIFRSYIALGISKKGFWNAICPIKPSLDFVVKVLVLYKIRTCKFLHRLAFRKNPDKWLMAIFLPIFPVGLIYSRSYAEFVLN